MSASQARQVEILAGLKVEIPDKLYFKIGEVSQLVGVQAHVLRYWEKEVPCIRPGKSASNQRRYRRKDVEYFREIRRLLYDERYTLAGARKRLMSGGDRGRGGGAPPTDSRRPAIGADPQDGQQQRPPQGPRVQGLGAEGPPPQVLTEAESQTAAVAFSELAATTPGLDVERLRRVREGLRDLIRMAGEEP